MLVLVRLSMNVLPTRKRASILHHLVEGSSIRSTARLVGCSKDTVSSLMMRAGEVAYDYHDRTVTNIVTHRIECDEMWDFCYAKQKNVEQAIAAPAEAGTFWTWVAIDSDTKLLLSWWVGGRDQEDANTFMADVASRLASRVQLTTDGWLAYSEAVWAAFMGKVDYAQMVKAHDANEDSPFITKVPIIGLPDERYVSTSIVERHNYTMRSQMKRYARRGNGFSKRLRYHCSALALYVLYYNFCRPHQSLKNPYPRTPAMAAGLDTHIRDFEWVVDLINAATPPPNRPKRYKKRKPVIADSGLCG